MALHLRWLNFINFKNYETVKSRCIPSKNKLKTQMNNKLRWLASDINFKLLHIGCPITHGHFSYLNSDHNVGTKFSFGRVKVRI